MKARQKRQVNILIFVVLVVYVICMYGSGVLRVRAINRQIAEINAEIKMWEERNSALKNEIAWLESMEYVEQVARKELGLVHPKETVYFVVTK